MLKLGIDLVEIHRIRQSMQNPRFLQRVFAQEEIAYFNTLSDPAQSIAANFAAKEAFGKALGTGIHGFSLNETAVLRDEKGAPYFKFSGHALDIVNNGNFICSVSLTHTSTTAGAVVIVNSVQ